MQKVFFRLVKDYLKGQNKIKYISLILFGIILSGATLIEPFFMKDIISGIEDYIKTKDFNINLFLNIFMLWGIYIILITTFKGLYQYKINQILLNGYTKLYKQKTKKLNIIDYESYLNKKQGEIYKIFDRGMEWSFFLLEQTLSRYIDVFVWVIVITIVLFSINITLAFATISMIPVMIFIGIYINGKTMGIQKKVNDKRDEAFGKLADSLSNLAIVKILTLEKLIQKILNIKIDYANKNQLLVTKRWVFSDIYTGLLVMISRFLVLSTGIYLLVNGKITFATLFLFYSFIGYIYFPLSTFFSSLKNIQKQLTGIEKFYKLFDSLQYEKETGKIKINKIEGNIEFKGVNFAYTKNKNILKKLSFKINSGEKIAFVGNTGAGKSTIVNLLFRFWDIDSGEILLDGKNINTISKDYLRKNIGLVMQDNSLFNTTILENLKFANPKATIKEIEKALKNAEANFVFKLKDGIKTVIGERGLKLSGGEKQRLSIARLFLKNPKILVLDEATSALDNKTEKLVQKALDKLVKGRTSIVIAHRLSTIQNADKIFMLENGEIIEKGNYEELMKKKKKFYELANPEHLILN